MNATNSQYVIALFDDEQSGELVLKKLSEIQKSQSVGVKEVALVRKSADGRTHIFEPADMGGGKGAAIGGVIGGLLGIVTGPGAILTASAGALIGGLAAKLTDYGFDNKDLKKLADALEPGKSALLVLVAVDRLSLVVGEMTEAGGMVIADALHPDIATELEQEHQKFMATLKITSEDGLLARARQDVDQNIRDYKQDTTSDLDAGYLWPLIQVN